MTPHLALASPGEEPPPGLNELDHRIVATRAAAGKPLGRTVLRARIRVRNERLGEVLSRLVSSGAVLRVGDYWSVPIPSSTP